MPKPEYEVADIFRQYGEAYRRNYKLTSWQYKVMWDIEHCRTATLGGHVDECDTCGTLRISYNSCRNRHCPKCGGLKRAEWLAARQVEWLPIEYFHVVFTTDHLINPLVGWNEKVVYNLLFRTATDTLKAFGERELGGQVGIVASLHTWGQDLAQHIHLHCIVTGGALSADGEAWNPCSKGYLFDTVELSAAFRDQFCQGLRAAYQGGTLAFGGACAELAQAERFAALLTEMQTKKWNVYAKETFGNPEQVFDYLGKDLNRGAFANYRLLGLEDGQVRFLWRDNRDEGRVKEMSLEAKEFIRRFLQHVLPQRFVRIRYYGLLGGNQRKEKLRCCRALLGLDPELPTVKPESYEVMLKQLTGIDVDVCPVCGVGHMLHKRDLEPLVGDQRWRRQGSPAEQWRRAA